MFWSGSPYDKRNPDQQNVGTHGSCVRRVWNKRLPGGLYLSSRAISVAFRTETKVQRPPESGGLNLVVIIEGNITEVHHKLRRYLNFIFRR